MASKSGTKTLWVCVLTIPPHYIDGSVNVGIYTAASEDEAKARAVKAYMKGRQPSWNEDEAKMAERLLRDTSATRVNSAPVEVCVLPTTYTEE